MSQFKDANGRTWTLNVHVGSIKRTRDATGVDITKLYGEDAAKVFADIVLTVNVLYMLVKPQADEAGISDEQFGEGLVGDAIERAHDALMDAVADFFPSSTRPLLVKMKQKGHEVGNVMTKRAARLLDQLADELIEKAESSTLSASATK